MPCSFGSSPSYVWGKVVRLCRQGKSHRRNFAGYGSDIAANPYAGLWELLERHAGEWAASRIWPDKNPPKNTTYHGNHGNYRYGGNQKSITYMFSIT